MAPLNSPDTGFPMIDHFMDESRAEYTAHPELLPDTTIHKHIPTPEELDFDEHLDGAHTRFQALISEVKTQLAPPCSAPAELTLAEEAEKLWAEKWTTEYRKAYALTDNILAKNEEFLEEVIGLVDDSKAKNSPIPDDIQLPPLPPSQKNGGMTRVPQDAVGWVQDSQKAWVEPGTRGTGRRPIQQPTDKLEKEEKWVSEWLTRELSKWLFKNQRAS